MRLTRAVKKRYVDHIEDLCKEYGLRFYVSDAHFKERSANGSCCGIREEGSKLSNYSKGQWTEALMIAKRTGKVSFSDIKPHLSYLADATNMQCKGFASNLNGKAECLALGSQTVQEFMRSRWNRVNNVKSPAMYFERVLIPIGKDENHDVIYQYNPEVAKR